MATYVFDGTANVSITNFDASTDTLILDGVQIADVASFVRNSTDVFIVLESGISVTLSGANLDALTNDNFSKAGTSDIEFAIGDGNPDDFSGNMGSGGFGADIIAVTSNDAVVDGNQQNDTIVGNGYENLFLFGGSGDDQISDFGGGSVIYGGLGEDFLSAPDLAPAAPPALFALAADPLAVTIYGGNGTSDSMDGGDNILGGDGGDLIYANAGNDSVYGNAGDDLIFGGLGDDTIFGDDDNGAAGNDTIYGNMGDDKLYADGGSDLVFGGQGDDYLQAYDAGSFAEDKVLLSGGLGADTLNAERSLSENITIYGGTGASDTADGDDSIYGSNQGDLIYGNAGNDSIIGYDGDDTIFGGLGDDTIDGGIGINALTGGAGADTFIANGVGKEDYSVITDFTKGEDLIDVTAVPTSVTKITGTGSTEYDSLAQVVTDFGSTLAAGTAVSVTVTNGDLAGITFVLADDGSAGSADEVIAMTGFTGTLTAADFV